MKNANLCALVPLKTASESKLGEGVVGEVFGVVGNEGVKGVVGN